MNEISFLSYMAVEYVDQPKQIKNLRIHLRLTQEEFADFLGVEKLTVCRWENGTRQCKGAAIVLINIMTKYNLWDKEIKVCP